MTGGLAWIGSMAGIWASIGLSIMGLAFVAWMARRAASHDRFLGARAYRDGLPLNPRWGKHMQDGWSDAFFAQLNKELAKRPDRPRR